jgi:hypothetical protein
MIKNMTNVFLSARRYIHCQSIEMNLIKKFVFFFLFYNFPPLFDSSSFFLLVGETSDDEDDEDGCRLDEEEDDTEATCEEAEDDPDEPLFELAEGGFSGVNIADFVDDDDGVDDGGGDDDADDADADSMLVDVVDDDDDDTATDDDNNGCWTAMVGGGKIFPLELANIAALGYSLSYTPNSMVAHVFDPREANSAHSLSSLMIAIMFWEMNFLNCLL